MRSPSSASERPSSSEAGVSTARPARSCGSQPTWTTWSWSTPMSRPRAELLLFVLLAAFVACKRGQEPTHKGFRSGGLPPESAPAAAPTADAGPAAPEKDPLAKQDVGRLQLGRGDEVLPADLAGIRLGMSTDEVRRLRPGATFAKAGDVAIEEAPNASLYSRFSYHFHEGKLAAVYLTLRHVDDLSEEFLAKARAKWGAPSETELDRATAKRFADRGERVVSW